MFIYVGGDWGRKWDEKRISAPLLSGIVAAGAVTISDVYAQTNTDRLIDVKANTDGLPGMLEALMSAVNDGVASILAAISSLQTSVDTSLGAIDADLSAIGADLDAIDARVSNVDSHVEEMHGDLGAIDAGLMEVHEDLSDVNAGMTKIGGDVMTVNDNVADLNAKVDSLTQTVNALAQAGSAIDSLAQANTATQEGVNANSAAINELKDLIMQVSTAVGVVQETVEEPEAEAAGPVNQLFNRQTKASVTVADFAGTKKASDGVYNANNMFSCDGDVFIKEVAMSALTLAQDGIGTDNADPPDNNDSVNEKLITKITSGDRDLYVAAFKTTASATATELNKPVTYTNLYHAEGMKLEIKGALDVTQEPTEGKRTMYISNGSSFNHNYAFTVDEYAEAKSTTKLADRTSGDSRDTTNLTRSEAGKVQLYDITVMWFTTNSDTTCSISTATGVSPDLTDSGEALVSLAVEGDGTIKAIKEQTVSCKNSAAQITEVDIEVGILNQFAEITLKAGDKDTTLKFMADGNTTANAKLPFDLGVNDLKITGKAVGSMLVELKYLTTSGNSCSAVTP